MLPTELLAAAFGFLDFFAYCNTVRSTCHEWREPRWQGQERAFYSSRSIDPELARQNIAGLERRLFVSSRTDEETVDVLSSLGHMWLMLGNGVLGHRLLTKAANMCRGLEWMPDWSLRFVRCVVKAASCVDYFCCKRGGCQRTNRQALELAHYQPIDRGPLHIRLLRLLAVDRCMSWIDREGGKALFLEAWREARDMNDGGELHDVLADFAQYYPHSDDGKLVLRLEAVRLALKANDPPRLAMANSRLAFFYARQAGVDRDQAVTWLRDASMVLTKVYGEQHCAVAWFLLAQANVLLKFGQARDADLLISRILDFKTSDPDILAKVEALKCEVRRQEARL